MTSSEDAQRPAGANEGSRARRPAGRKSTETKASLKTTELIAYVGMLIAIFIAGAVTKGGTSNGVHHADSSNAHQMWLYATILTIGYMISRGLAKAGSRDYYDAG